PSSGGTTVLVDDGVPSYTIGGLDIGTAYDFYVQSICTGHDTSDYSVPLSVTTKSLYMYTVNCGEDPVDATFCYHADDPLSVSYVASDPQKVLNFIINSGNISGNINIDGGEFTVFDSDGSIIYSGYGNEGDLSGMSFQSTGDTISFSYIGPFDCVEFAYEPFDITVECSDCLNPQADFTVIPECDSDPQFLVD